MDYSPVMTSEASSLKRPRSPSEHHPLPAAKVPRTATNHLQINYLARQHKETIPLVTVNDKLPEIARLLGEYDGVLQRHESMAGNLGACPLGPILLKRFERLFEGPPKVLKSHAKDSTISWLDVVEFAQSSPKQFNLERTRNGVRVCQFYTKQCRVEISEEDYVLIASGMPQKLIPPQPILEDEEKELGVMDLLDRNIGQIIQLADQVSGRARQMIHKMKNRRTAILSRREQEVESRKVALRTDGSPLSPADTNGVPNKPVRSIEVSQSPPVGFTAVNLRHAGAGEADPRPQASGGGESVRNLTVELFATPNTQNATIINGKSMKDASPTVRAELMKKFLTPSEREAGLTEDTIRRSSFSAARTTTMHTSPAENPRSDSLELAGSGGTPKNPPTVAIPNTPASLMPHLKPSTLERDDGGPFKSEMVRRMDNMWKGDRVIPPCDRCRRLHMDCLKNLTACMGCTKKHAKCSWKEVKAPELQGLAPPPASVEKDPGSAPSGLDPAPPLSAGSTIEVSRPAEESRPVSTARTSLGSAHDREAKHDGAVPKTDTSRRSESMQSPNVPSARFDVRPPPLVQQIQETANGRSSTGLGGHRSFGMSGLSPASRPASRLDDDDDQGDRLQALASRVYRTASQSGHRI